MCYTILAIFFWDVKHAQSFEADCNMRLRPCHVTQCSPYALTRSLSNTIYSCYKVHHCLYNIHQQHRLSELQQDCFHIKIYKKISPLLIPSPTQDLQVELCSFFGANNLTNTMKMSHSGSPDKVNIHS